MKTNLSIVLAKYNWEGLHASIEDDDEMDDICIHVDKCTDDAEAVCRIAAKRLRLLADAFDILATMDDPCRPVTRDAALAAARQAQRMERHP